MAAPASAKTLEVSPKYKNLYTVKLNKTDTSYTQAIYSTFKDVYHEETLASLLFALINDRAPTTFAVSFHKPVNCDRLVPTLPRLWNKPYGTNTEKQIAISTKCLA
jgi:hypothetical protein